MNDLNFVISIIRPLGANVLSSICAELEIPLAMSFLGKGTAPKNIVDFLGLESNEKRIFVTVSNSEKTKMFINEQRKRLYIDAPGNGVVISVPVKSVGGGSTLEYLSDNSVKKEEPELMFDFELIMVIANEGYTDAVMDAAREVGARGGTVIHGKGTGSKNAEKFFNVSIASEKELIMIVSKSSDKSEIMRNIVKKAGRDTPAGAIVMSLPVNDIAGLTFGEK